MLDYTIPGVASKPPSFDNHPPTPKSGPELETEVIDYTHGGMPRPGSIYERRAPLDRVPGSVRRDLVRAQTMAHDLTKSSDEPELMTWDQVRGQADDDRVVSFGRPAAFREAPVLIPAPWAAAVMGQVVQRPRQTRAAAGQQLSQKTPVIL